MEWNVVVEDDVSIDESIRATISNIATTIEKVNTGINSIECKLDSVYERLDTGDEKLDAVNKRLDTVEKTMLKIEENNSKFEHRIIKLLESMENDRKIYFANKDTYVSLLTELKEQEHQNSEQLLKGQQSISNITNSILNPSNVHRLFNSAWRSSSKNTTTPVGLDLEKLIYSKEEKEDSGNQPPVLDWNKFIK